MNQPAHAVTPAPGPPPVVYVAFSAEINPNTSESLISVMSNLINQRVPQVYLLFSTPGGTVMNGMNLYAFLRGVPFDLIVHNVGNVDSIGNAIFLAGQTRYACPQATFMFHGVGFDQHPGRLEEKILRERLGSVLSDQRRIGEVIEQRTNLRRREVAKLFREAQTKNATQAVRCGIIHDIRDVQIPAGGPVISLVFQR